MSENNLRAFKYIVHSENPKTATVKCTVPNCSRSWYLSGGYQGFILAAAQRHCSAHWRRFHHEMKHPKAVWKDSYGVEHEGYHFCQQCKDISHREYFNK